LGGNKSLGFLRTECGSGTTIGVGSIYLSKAGKEIIIKSCAQVVPTYCMSVSFTLNFRGRTSENDELLLVGFKRQHERYKIDELE